MFEPWLERKVFIICFIWFVGSLLGLGRLLTANPRQPGRCARALGLPVVLLLAGLAAGAYAPGGPPALWQPPLILAGVYGSLLALGFRPLGRWVTLALDSSRDGRAQALLLLLGCPVLAVWLGTQVALPPSELSFAESVEELFGEGEELGDSPLLSQSPSGPALTDCDRPVALHTCTYPIPSQQLALRTEAALFRAKGYDGRILRTGPPDWSYNCHGWVFTGGRYWICKGSDVASILQDNDYAPVSRPEHGDLAVYRDGRGGIVHSGVVRAVEDDGLVLVESKWGTMGRFVHPSDLYPYRNAVCTYHRSPRKGHLINGADGSAPERGAAAAAPPLTP